MSEPQTFSDEATKASHEALQNKINTDRDTFLATLSPEMRERFDKVHKAAELLDGAKIPFLLLADPQENLGLMQYNQMCYKHELYSPKYLEEASSLTARMHEYLSKLYCGAFPYNTVSYSWPDGRIFLQIDRNGKQSPPPEFLDTKESTPQTEAK